MQVIQGRSSVQHFGVSTTVLRQLHQRITDRGVSESDMHSLVTGGGTVVLDMVASKIARAVTTRRTRYPVTAHHSSLQEAIAALRCMFIDPDITSEHFEIRGPIDIHSDFVLYRMSEDIVDSNAVIRELQDINLKPATLPELCAFGAMFRPSVSVLALGSVWEDRSGVSHVVSLTNDEDRDLILEDWSQEWDPNHFGVLATEM